MSGSYTRRGLAALAVSALAVTGAPWLASPASADASAVTICAPFSATASAKNDGVNTKIHLLADAPAQYGTGTTAVAVKGMKFEYRIGAATTWNTIGTTMTRPFSLEWDAPANVDGVAVEVRATPVDAAGAAISDPAAVAATHGFTVNNSKSSIDIANAPLSEVGVFGGQAIVAGTTSGGAVELSNRTMTADTPDAATLGGATTDAVRPFEGVVDVASFDDTDSAADEIVVGAQVDSTAGGSDDAEMLSVYNQKVTDVSVSPTASVVPNGGTSTFVVTVKDQKGKPVYGVSVEPSVDGTAGTAKSTGMDGKVSSDVVDGNNADKAIQFVVNTDSEAGYQTNKDYRLNAAQDVYAPVAAEISVGTPNGTVFDDDEVGMAGVAVLVKDQNGNPMVGQRVWYRDVFTPRDTAQQVDTGAWVSADSGPEGKVSLPVDGRDGVHRLESYIVRDGEPGPSAGDLIASPVSVKVGPAAIAWAEGQVAQPGAGATTVQKAVLSLPDGTPLPGRSVNFRYNASADSKLADQAAQPAGTTRASDSTGSANTGNDGAFSVAVVDPAAAAPAPQVDEKGNTLAATGVGFPITGLTVDFLKVNTPMAIAIDDVTKLFTGATPGRPVSQHLTVTNGEGTALSDVQVNVSVDHGFFTPYAADKGALVPDPAPAEGAIYGNWKNEGSSQSLVTKDATDGSRGTAGYTMAIGRDAGFDDDGYVTTTVTATAGPVTETREFVWTTTDGFVPLNPDADKPLEVVLSAEQESKSLPWAHTDQWVGYDVRARDQFGNLVEAPITVGDNDPNDAASYGAPIGYSSNFTGDGPSFNAYMGYGYEGTLKDLAQTVKATWDAQRAVWHDYDAAADKTAWDREPVFTDPVKNPAIVDSADNSIHWYSQSYEQGTYTLTHDTADVVKVGTPVTETLTALDQHGQALEYVYVDFFRAGPDANQDGDVKEASDWVNENGKVSYTYTGAVQGEGDTSAVVRYNDDEYDGPFGLAAAPADGTILGKATDTVSFTATPSISAPTSRKGAGRVAIAGQTRPGAEVKLYQMNNGETTYTEVGTRTADVVGAYRFVGSMTKSARFYVRADDVANSASRYVKMIQAPTLSLGTSRGWTTARVNTNPDVAGQTVNLYRVNRDGSKTKIRSEETGAGGNATFRVNTAKGKTYKFVARVTTGQGCYGAWSSVKSIRSS